ncbi:hypothetical protein GCM10009765_23740 [Fodinicola feengrottensis]|uniref:Tetratricopeptide repeat protein n=1 Tax=Fodinicola feengrottensis TaxID=435914 RepID=A0ABP4SKC7_9ACTN
MTFALLTVLLNTATEYEAQVVREVAIRAGLMWTCSGCGRHHPADTPICPECATTAGPALFRRFPSAPAAPGIVAAAWIALSTALDARRASPNTTTRPEDLIQVGVGLRLTPVLHHAVTVATSAEAASADHLWAQLTGQLPPPLAAPAAMLRAITAYRHNDLAQANAHLRRAIGDDPSFVPAHLTLRRLRHGCQPADLAPSLLAALDAEGGATHRRS